MRTQPTSASENEVPAEEATAAVEAEIRRLIGAGKCKQAVEKAKDHHKRTASSGSQRLIVEAYVARIEQFQNQGMAPEAQTLIALVQQRFPSEQHQLSKTLIRAAAAGGRLDDLLRPLASPDTSPETQSLVESTLRRYVTDLTALAACEALPSAHPLRVGAAAVWTAFLAVTEGPVNDEQIALPQVPHRSPLAPWKLLVRAIAAFYRREDPTCQKALDAIPPDSSLAALADAVRAMLGAQRPRAGAAAALYDRVAAGDESLRSALNSIEVSKYDRDLTRLLRSIRDALRLCAAVRPEWLEQLKQRLWVWCRIQDVPRDDIKTALVPRKDASFWRLMALATERDGELADSALYWERFLRHSVHEGAFTENGPEAGAIWLHIAAMLSSAWPDDLQTDRDRVAEYRLVSEEYDGQPRGIAVLRPASDRKLAGEVLAPGEAFAKSTRNVPDPETFNAWWSWAERANLPSKKKDQIAAQWAQSRPRDLEPLIKLSSLAESRGALSLAMKRLTDAEALDPLNQVVRQARVRLMLSIAWQHFKERKPHLVEKDLAELEALPGLGDGDRAAMVESMRGAWHALRGDESGAAKSLKLVEERMGPLAGLMLFNSVACMARQSGTFEWTSSPEQLSSSPLDVARALARLVQLGNDLRLPIHTPPGWRKTVTDALKQHPSPLSAPEILSLGRAALSASEAKLAYLASAAGLTRADSPPLVARMLLLRARSLAEPWQHPRAVQCLWAALQLARQAHDEALIRDIFLEIDRDPVTRSHLIDQGPDGAGPNPNTLDEAIGNEHRATSFPASAADVDLCLASGLRPALTSRPGRSRSGASNWYDEEEEQDEDGQPTLPFPGQPAPAGSGIPLFAEFQQMFDAALDDGGGLSPDLQLDPAKLIDAMAKRAGQEISPALRREMLEELQRMFTEADLPEETFGRKKKGTKRRR